VYDEAPDVVSLTGLNDVYLGAYCGVASGTPSSRGFGYLILKPTQDAIAQALDPLTKVFFGLSVLVLLITAAIGYLISASITRPIAALVRGTAEVSKGNYDYRIDVQTGGELNFLAERFGEMSASLKNNIGELAERNLELKEIISSAADGIVVYDNDLRYTVWNPFMEKMTGISAESVMGKDGRTQVPQLYAHGVSTLLQRALAGETVRTPDMYFQIPESGKSGWFVATYGPRRSTGGEIIGVIGVITDLTERRRAEDAVRSSEEKYRNVFEQSKDTIFISTPEGKLLDINPAGVELFGYSSKEELMSVDISRDLYLNARDRERFQRALEERGFVRDHQLELKKKDGSKSTVLETTTVVRDDSGAIIAYRGIMRDITERQQLEERLRQAHKMESIGNLAGGIAHDFNNILGIILGYASILDRGPADETKLTTSLESIKKAALRGADLVKQILTFARRSDVLLESVKVNPVIEELRGLILETFPKTIAIDLDLDPKLPSIVGDHGQIHQSVLNLCVNARDAMPKGGSITISTNVSSGDLVRDIFPEADDEQYVCLGVTDTGTGMSEETRSKIFEPFFTTKERGKGTGLGLAVVYGIVRSHRGFIDVRSKPGMGTTFNLYFPVPLQRVVNVRKADGIGAIPKGTETILLVEDEEMLLEFTRSLIESYGYTTIVATDGVEAVERFRSNYANIALVLSDMGLPKLGGLEALIEMKKIDPRVKAILASGYLDPQVRAEMLRVDAKDFLQKPYDPKELLKTIRSVIDRPIT
jgi:PAS domain S-box-containing protein